MFKEEFKIEESNDSTFSIIHDFGNLAQIRIKQIDHMEPIEEKITLFHLTKSDAKRIITLLNDFVDKKRNKNEKKK